MFASASLVLIGLFKWAGLWKGLATAMDVTGEIELGGVHFPRTN